nr:hypothetical protein [Tanacetum cinerariifolium]
MTYDEIRPMFEKHFNSIVAFLEKGKKELEEEASKGRLQESQAQVYHLDLEHAQKVLRMQDDEAEPAEITEVIKVVTTAKLMTEVVTAAAATTATTTVNT